MRYLINTTHKKILHDMIGSDILHTQGDTRELTVTKISSQEIL